MDKVLNQRRCELIDKEFAGLISVEEQTELSALQTQAELFFDNNAPPDIATVEELLIGLKARIAGDTSDPSPS